MAEYVALGLILSVALYLFWTQKFPYELTALLVLVALILVWVGRGDPRLTQAIAPQRRLSRGRA